MTGARPKASPGREWWAAVSGVVRAVIPAATAADMAGSVIGAPTAAGKFERVDDRQRGVAGPVVGAVTALVVARVVPRAIVGAAAAARHFLGAEERQHECGAGHLGGRAARGRGTGQSRSRGEGEGEKGGEHEQADEANGNEASNETSNG